VAGQVPLPAGRKEAKVRQPHKKPKEKH